jgi:hypothetical protein
MAADPGTIAVMFGLDKGALEPVRLDSAEVMGKVRASLASAPEAVRNLAAGSISDALKSALDVSLGDVLLAAWKTRQDLLEHCDQSKYPPGEVSNYVLAEHVVTSTHKPRFQILFDGAPCGPEIEFDVELKLTIEGACLEILDARIMKVATGAVQGSGTISCAGLTLVDRQTKKVDLPGEISFGEGFLIGNPYRSTPPPAAPAG